MLTGMYISDQIIPAMAISFRALKACTCMTTEYTNDLVALGYADPVTSCVGSV